jgi:hypothetical protein
MAGVGVPATITSDRGAQFTSTLWAGLCSLLNIQHSPTTAYHPQSNGLVERFHRRLKEALWSRAAADWHDHLPWVMLGIRASFREDSKFSPAEAVFGSQLILPGQFVNAAKSPLSSFLSDLPTTMTGRPPLPMRHNSTQLQPIYTTRGAAAGPLRSGPPGRCAAAAVADLRRPLPSTGAVNTFLSPRNRR